MIRRNDSRLDPQFCLASGSFEFSEFSQLIKVSSSDRVSSKLGISNQSFYVVFARPVQVYPSDLELYSGRGGCRVEHKVFPVWYPTTDVQNMEDPKSGIPNLVSTIWYSPSNILLLISNSASSFISWVLDTVGLWLTRLSVASQGKGWTILKSFRVVLLLQIWRNSPEECQIEMELLWKWLKTIGTTKPMNWDEIE